MKGAGGYTTLEYRGFELRMREITTADGPLVEWVYAKKRRETLQVLWVRLCTLERSLVLGGGEQEGVCTRTSSSESLHKGEKGGYRVLRLSTEVRYAFDRI